MSLSETLASRFLLGEGVQRRDVTVGGSGRGVVRVHRLTQDVDSPMHALCLERFQRSERVVERVAGDEAVNHPPRQRDRSRNAAQCAATRGPQEHGLGRFRGNLAGMEARCLFAGLSLAPPLEFRGDRLGRNYAVERAVRLRIERDNRC